MINEINSTGGEGDYVEFINTGSTAVAIGNWTFTDALPSTDGGARPTYTFAAGTTVQPGQIISVLNEDAPDAGADVFTFGLGQGDSIILRNAGGTVVDSYMWPVNTHAQPHGRCPNGTGAFRANNSRTRGAANDCSALDGGTP
jgi:hypothetical protein